jgi:hypothetical protein
MATALASRRLAAAARLDPARATDKTTEFIIAQNT